MIYYPLSVLMLAGIRDILIIVKKIDLLNYKALLGDGNKFGINIQFEIQDMPNGIAEAFIVGKDFIGRDSVCLILGDNLFIGDDLTQKLNDAVNKKTGCSIFVTHVNDPKRYGIAVLDKHSNLVSVEEKPDNPRSNLAITGIYFFDNDVVKFARRVQPSDRGELEITSVIEMYRKSSTVHVSHMGRGFSWLDAGTVDSLLEASEFIHTLQKRQGLLFCSPEEIAFNRGWISPEALKGAIGQNRNEYARYLLSLIEEN